MSIYTHITSNRLHVACQLQVHGIRHDCVASKVLFVSDVGLHSGCLLSLYNTPHIHRRVEFQLRLVIVLFVVFLTLYFCHFHVVHQQWVVLKTTEANMVAPGLLIIQFILVLLHGKRQIR